MASSSAVKLQPKPATEEEKKDQPRKRRPRKQPMPADDMYRRWPALRKLAGPPGDPDGVQAWEAAFTVRPEAMHSLLQDLIKQTYAKPGRIGQRPMPKEEEVDFHGLIYGDQNDLPMIEILPKLMRVSERMFAQKIAMSRSTFQRMMRGEYYPDINEIRQIAEAINKPPTFFVEYRKMMAVAAFVNLLEDRPGIASKIYKDYLEAKAS